MSKCLICKTEIAPFMSFGKMPIANGFLPPEQFKDEPFFKLDAAFCDNCKMAQLTELVDRDKMFHENYAFYSSTSAGMAEHFKEFAKLVKSSYLPKKKPFVVEIGSNDGILLRHFASAAINYLGIEPSANVAKAAGDNGINTVCEFFEEKSAARIAAEHGKADAFLGANVMCHIPYIHSVLNGIDALLKPEGVVIFEDPYLGDILEKTSYDQIYDEHAFYFAARSVSYLFERHGFELADVMPQDVHGGSMRYVLARKGTRKVSDAVPALLKKEEALGIGRPDTYERFRTNVEASRTELVKLLKEMQQAKKSVAGYAATSKSTTVLNYCGIGPDLVEYISDTTPIKQGKYSPGMHIPIRPYDDFKEKYPDYALLFGWNHAREIMEKERDFRRAGGKWIVYVPRVQVL
ncbi:MAG: class I SAM-dependent methyltransferase [Elusimicrobia bacterium]|nr:class I SAM-dependent methyltransferase [Elusimicrobiota bacterium]